MAKLPKALIRKYGISKKAWAVFRGERKTSSRGAYSMARKHKGHKKGSKGGFMRTVGKILLGAAVAGLYEVFVSPMIKLNRTIKNVIELVIGIVIAAWPKMPMAVRAGGAALATINAFELVVPLIAGFSNKTAAATKMSLANVN